MDDENCTDQQQQERGGHEEEEGRGKSRGAPRDGSSEELYLEELGLRRELMRHMRAQPPGVAELHTHLMGMGSADFWLDIVVVWHRYERLKKLKKTFEEEPPREHRPERGDWLWKYFPNQRSLSDKPTLPTPGDQELSALYREGFEYHPQVWEDAEELSDLQQLFTLTSSKDDESGVFQCDIVLTVASLRVAFNLPDLIPEGLAEHEIISRLHVAGSCARRRRGVVSNLRDWIVWVPKDNEFRIKRGIPCSVIVSLCSLDRPECTRTLSQRSVVAHLRNAFSVLGMDGKDAELHDILDCRGHFTPQFNPRRFVLKDDLIDQDPSILQRLLKWELTRLERAGVKYVEFSVSLKDLTCPIVVQHLALVPDVHWDPSTREQRGAVERGYWNCQTEYHFLAAVRRDAVLNASMVLSSDLIHPRVRTLLQLEQLRDRPSHTQSHRVFSAFNFFAGRPEIVPPLAEYFSSALFTRQYEFLVGPDNRYDGDPYVQTFKKILEKLERLRDCLLADDKQLWFCQEGGDKGKKLWCSVKHFYATTVVGFDEVGDELGAPFFTLGSRPVVALVHEIRLQLEGYNPGFGVRLHAGEATPLPHIEGVPGERERYLAVNARSHMIPALLAIRALRQVKVKPGPGKKKLGMRIRLGHGVTLTTSSCETLLRYFLQAHFKVDEKGVTLPVEVNVTSNFYLLHGGGGEALRFFLNNHLRCCPVLCTDDEGILPASCYCTDSPHASIFNELCTAIAKYNLTKAEVDVLLGNSARTEIRFYSGEQGNTGPPDDGPRIPKYFDWDQKLGDVKTEVGPHTQLYTWSEYAVTACPDNHLLVLFLVFFEACNPFLVDYLKTMKKLNEIVDEYERSSTVRDEEEAGGSEGGEKGDSDKEEETSDEEEVQGKVGQGGEGAGEGGEGTEEEETSDEEEVGGKKVEEAGGSKGGEKGNSDEDEETSDEKEVEGKVEQAGNGAGGGGGVNTLFEFSSTLMSRVGNEMQCSEAAKDVARRFAGITTDQQFLEYLVGARTAGDPEVSVLIDTQSRKYVQVKLGSSVVVVSLTPSSERKFFKQFRVNKEPSKTTVLRPGRELFVDTTLSRRFGFAANCVRSSAVTVGHRDSPVKTEFRVVFPDRFALPDMHSTLATLVSGVIRTPGTFLSSPDLFLHYKQWQIHCQSLARRQCISHEHEPVKDTEADYWTSTWLKELERLKIEDEDNAKSLLLRNVEGLKQEFKAGEGVRVDFDREAEEYKSFEDIESAVSACGSFHKADTIIASLVTLYEKWRDSPACAFSVTSDQLLDLLKEFHCHNQLTWSLRYAPRRGTARNEIALYVVPCYLVAALGTTGEEKVYNQLGALWKKHVAEPRGSQAPSTTPWTLPLELARDDATKLRQDLQDSQRWDPPSTSATTAGGSAEERAGTRVRGRTMGSGTAGEASEESRLDRSKTGSPVKRRRR